MACASESSKSQVALATTELPDYPFGFKRRQRDAGKRLNSPRALKRPATIMRPLTRLDHCRNSGTTSVCGVGPVTWILPVASMKTFTSLRTPNSGR